MEYDVNLEQSVKVKLKYWMNDEFQDFSKADEISNIE